MFLNIIKIRWYWVSQVALVLKNPPASAGNRRDVGLIPGVEKILQGREWRPTQVFLPVESHGQRSLAGAQTLRHDWRNLAHPIVLFSMMSMLIISMTTITSIMTSLLTLWQLLPNTHMTDTVLGNSRALFNSPHNKTIARWDFKDGDTPQGTVCANTWMDILKIRQVQPQQRIVIHQLNHRSGGTV